MKRIIFMLGKPFLKKTFAFLMILMLMLSISVNAFAAKGGDNPPTNTTPTAPEIITVVPTIVTDINLNVVFTITAKYKDPNLVKWVVAPESSNLMVKNISINTKRATSTVTYSFLSASSGTFNYSISAMAGGLTSSPTNVTIEVKGVVPPPPPIETKTLTYVALGDSIATGTTGLGSETPYVSKFRDYLNNLPNTDVDYRDFSFDGDQSSHLLSKLTSDSRMIAAVQAADIITITIGSNNLMQAAKGVDGKYDFNKIDFIKAEAGRAAFEIEWPLIVERINSLKKVGAKVIVMTIYNPYNIQDTLHNSVNSLMTNESKNGINDIIRSNATTMYSVADVYTDFYSFAKVNNMKSITHFYDKILFFIDAKDPHPNSTGQERIYNIHKLVYESL